ncbi:MAG: transcription-repair-coupling factor [Rhodothalassiaceae bacterium]|nr:MAG: transcription-repair-coupling factor [Rhodothalassiaceae bacterium]
MALLSLPADALDRLLEADRRPEAGRVPPGFEAVLLPALLRRAAETGTRPARLLHIARDGGEMTRLAALLRFFAPSLEIVTLPAWDNLPYDQNSPSADVMGARVRALARITELGREERPALVLTTLAAAMQRLPDPAFVAAHALALRPGVAIAMDDLASRLAAAGYRAVSEVQAPGEFARRGGLLDIFPPGEEEPRRLDFFGDELERIRRFDPLDQRSTGEVEELRLLPAGELVLTAETIRHFRQAYTARFSGAAREDPLYQAVSEGRHPPGLEHWLPLFHERLAPVFAHLPAGTIVTVPAGLDELFAERRLQIEQAWEARHALFERDGRSGFESRPPGRPLPPEALYLSRDEWTDLLDEAAAITLSPFDAGTPGASFAARPGRDFAPERAERGRNVYEAAVAHIAELAAHGRRVVLTGAAAGALERLASVLADHGLRACVPVGTAGELAALPAGAVARAVLPLEHGFTVGDLAFVTEEDILGPREIRPRAGRRARRAAILEGLTQFHPGDLVVHRDHGVGRFLGLETITVAGAPHDCLVIAYAGDDKLYVPVENIELVSRFGGGEETAVELDRLGSSAWQARKARVKKRIREIAGELIRIAAARKLREAPVMEVEPALLEEFAAGFPYAETEDQARSIAEVLEDLKRGAPMDRLVCGDVGFGKTEVAMRAAFVAAMSGWQVAVVVPTTLLARQHMATFSERFRGFPVRIGQLSRLVSAKEARQVKEELAAGRLDIVIGTHALLAKDVRFKRLGLVIVDEEQHFGVRHKEALKRLRAEVHVLTLTATPIPRTLQLALAGIRDLSLITTPPVDRLAVRTFVLKFDPLILREALLREHYRGGQSFVVAPRIEDLPQLQRFLEEEVPEVRFVVAHGRMRPRELEERMQAFYEGRADVLLSTSIIESGLDIPRANTLIVHRADRFGLAQLYQIRGRIGRSRQRAYAYLMLPARGGVTEQARKRLEVLSALDTLGAGFTLASHDLDIRGAGNLLGEEQSGHIREVGVELYQEMLEAAIAELKAGIGEAAQEAPEEISPQIQLGAKVMIPESYVADLDLRLQLYRRLGQIRDEREIPAFAEELEDRFGPLPAEVGQLLRIVQIKLVAARAHVEKLEAGPKGFVIRFAGGRFPDPGGLVAWLSSGRAEARLRPDHSLVIHARTTGLQERLDLVLRVLRMLARIADRRSDGGRPAAMAAKGG